MVQDISVVAATLLTVCLEGCLYGVMLVLLCLSTYLLVVRGPQGISFQGRLRWALRNPFIYSGLAIAACATAHWVVTCTRAFAVFVAQDPGYLTDFGQPSEIANTATLVLGGVLSDCMCLYRAWVIWGRNKYILVFPVLTLIGFFVSGIGTSVIFSTFRNGDIFAARLTPWIYGIAYFSTGTNIYTTAIILWKIMSLDKTFQQIRSTQKATTTLGLVVESAMIYTIWLIFFAATYQAHSNLQFVSNNCIASISAISVMFINIRIGLGWAHKSLAVAGAPRPVGPIFGNPLGRTHGLISDDDYTFPLSVRIEQVVKSDHCAISFVNKDNQSVETTN